MSVPSSELGPPPPIPYPASDCVPPLEPRRGTYSPAGEGVGGPNWEDLGKKPSTLSSLCFKGWLKLMYHQLKRRVHCIKSELYLAKWKWILRSGPKLKMLVKFHLPNGSFPSPLNWWQIRFGCTALDQCYWNGENWFGPEPDLLLAKYFYNWYFTFMPGSTCPPPPPNIKKINTVLCTQGDSTARHRITKLHLWPLDHCCSYDQESEREYMYSDCGQGQVAGTGGGGEGGKTPPLNIYIIY